MSQNDRGKGQEDESPEERMNRHLASTLDDRQRSSDMAQTSARMMQIMSRFISDPIVVEDLDNSPDEGKTTSSVSSPSSSASSSSTKTSENDDSSNDDPGHGLPPSVLTYRAVGTQAAPVTVQGSHLMSHRFRQHMQQRRRQQQQQQQQQQQRQQQQQSGQVVQGEGIGTEKSDSQEKEEDQEPPPMVMATNPGGGGDFEQPTSRGTAVSSATPRATNRGQQSSTDMEDAQPAPANGVSIGTQLGRWQLYRETGRISNGDSARGVGGRRVSIGLLARENINSTMAEISKAAATIQQARAMLSVFNRRTQANTNRRMQENANRRMQENANQHKQENANGQTTEYTNGRIAVERQADDFSQKEQARSECSQGGGVDGPGQELPTGHGLADSETARKTDAGGKTRSGPLLVRPAPRTGAAPSDRLHEGSEKPSDNSWTDYPPDTGGSTRVGPPAPVSNPSGIQWSFTQAPIGHHNIYGGSQIGLNVHSRNLMVTTIGGNVRPASVDAGRDITAEANTDSDNLGPQHQSKGSDVTFGASIATDYTGLQHQTEGSEVNSDPKLYTRVLLSAKKPAVPDDIFLITLNMFQDALKEAVKNLEKEGRWSARNLNSESEFIPKVGTKMFLFPEIKSPTSQQTSAPSPHPVGRGPPASPFPEPGESTASPKPDKGDDVDSFNFKPDSEQLSSPKFDVSDPDKETLSTGGGCKLDLSFNPSPTLVQPFGGSDDTLNSDMEPISTGKDEVNNADGDTADSQDTDNNLREGEITELFDAECNLTDGDSTEPFDGVDDDVNLADEENIAAFEDDKKIANGQNAQPFNTEGKAKSEVIKENSQEIAVENPPREKLSERIGDSSHVSDKFKEDAPTRTSDLGRKPGGGSPSDKSNHEPPGEVMHVKTNHRVSTGKAGSETDREGSEFNALDQNALGDIGGEQTQKERASVFRRFTSTIQRWFRRKP